MPQIPAQAPPAPAMQAPGRLNVGGEEILDGPGVPAELRGRKVSEVMRIYGALTQNFLSTQNRAQNPQAPPSQPQVQAPAPQAPAPQVQSFRPQMPAQPQFQPQAPQQMSNLTIEDVRQVVHEAVAPFTPNVIETAKARAVQFIPDFKELEADIILALRGSSQQALADPEYWISAADLARGKRMRAQVPQTPQIPQTPHALQFGAFPQPTSPQFAPPLLPGQNPHVPPMAQPQRPQPAQFFSEAPTAPGINQGTYAAVPQLTAAEKNVADKAGMSYEVYAAWKTAAGQGNR